MCFFERMAAKHEHNRALFESQLSVSILKRKVRPPVHKRREGAKHFRKYLKSSSSLGLLHSTIMHTSIDPHSCTGAGDVDDNCTSDQSCHFCSAEHKDLSILLLSLKKILIQALYAQIHACIKP